MELVCALGFWAVTMANSSVLYTDHLRTMEIGLVRAAVCRPWNSLLPLVKPSQEIRILGLGRQGYPTCREARKAMRWSDLPCSPWESKR